MFTIQSGKGKRREAGGTGVSADTMEAFSHRGERGLRTPEEVLGRVGCRGGRDNRRRLRWVDAGVEDMIFLNPIPFILRELNSGGGGEGRKSRDGCEIAHVCLRTC